MIPAKKKSSGNVTIRETTVNRLYYSNCMRCRLLEDVQLDSWHTQRSMLNRCNDPEHHSDKRSAAAIWSLLFWELLQCRSIRSLVVNLLFYSLCNGDEARTCYPVDCQTVAYVISELNWTATTQVIHLLDLTRSVATPDRKERVNASHRTKATNGTNNINGDSVYESWQNLLNTDLPCSSFLTYLVHMWWIRPKERMNTSYTVM